MASYSVAEAKDHLSSLITRAEAGEDIVITRRGKPAAEIRGVRSAAKNPRDVQAAHSWLAEQRAKLPPVSITSAEILRMEDEDSEH